MENNEIMRNDVMEGATDVAETVGATGGMHPLVKVALTVGAVATIVGGIILFKRRKAKKAAQADNAVVLDDNACEDVED